MFLKLLLSLNLGVGWRGVFLSVLGLSLSTDVFLENTLGVVSLRLTLDFAKSPLLPILGAVLDGSLDDLGVPDLAVVIVGVFVIELSLFVVELSLLVFKLEFELLFCIELRLSVFLLTASLIFELI